MSNAGVKTIMSTDLKTVSSEDSLETAFRRFREFGIRHLPVTNEHGSVIGILSDRDLLRANVAIANGALVFAPGAKVSSFMSTALKTVSINDDLQEALSLMLGEKISSCLVEEKGKIVGIVTYDDLIRLLKDYLSAPRGSVRTALATLVATAPLGPMSLLLAKVAL